MKHSSSQTAQTRPIRRCLFPFFFLQPLSRAYGAGRFVGCGGHWRHSLARGVYVPNYSFETPAVPDTSPFAQPELDYWEQTAQPADYNTNGFPWFELVGAFYKRSGGRRLY